MTTETTSPPADAPAAPARPASRRAASRQVSVRPLAVGVANVATMGASTLAHVAGPTGLAMAAGAAALAAGAGAASQARSNRQRTGSMWRSTPRRGGASLTGASPRRGRSGSGLSHAGGGGRVLGGLGRSAKGGRTGAASGPTGGRQAGRAGGGTPSRGRSSVGASRRLRRAAKSAGGWLGIGPARSRSAGRPARQKASGPTIPAAVRAGIAPTKTGQRPTPRQAWRAARQAVTGQKRVRRGHVRRIVAGLVAGGVAAGRAAWATRRRRHRRRAANDTPSTKAKRRSVRTMVRRPDAKAVPDGTNETTSPTTKPAPIHTTGGTTMARHLLGLADDYLAAAMRDLPSGMLQVVADAYQLPRELERFADAMKARYDRAREHPVHPAIKDAYSAVVSAQLAVVKAASEIAPAIERIHEEELQRLRNPRLRGDERMWDVRANEGTAAA